MGRAIDYSREPAPYAYHWTAGVEVVAGYMRLKVPTGKKKCPCCGEKTSRLKCYGEAWGYQCEACGYEGKQVHPSPFEAAVWHGRSKVVSACRARLKAAAILKGVGE